MRKVLKIEDKPAFDDVTIQDLGGLAPDLARRLEQGADAAALEEVRKTVP